MQKYVKIYLVLSLVCLQFIAPFIHAHALGLDSYAEHTFHIHADNAFQSNTNVVIAQQHGANAQAAVHGTVFTVSNGLKPQAPIDLLLNTLADVAVLLTFLFALFQSSHRFKPAQLRRVAYQNPPYPSHNPRAPPTY